MPTFISFLILMIPCFLASELDLLSSINYSSLKKGNDTTKNKLISNLPVYRFHRSFKNFMLMRNASSNFLNTVDNILGLVFIFKPSRNQHQIANLFSINTPGRTSPELQIIVNFKKRHFIIHYISSTSGSLKKQIVKMIGRSFHGWTALDMTLHPTFVDIQVNCKSFRVKIDDGIQFMFDKDSLIYFRQEPGYKLQFVGKFQVAKLRNHASKNLPWKCYSRSEFD